ncbi:complex I subunit 5 family protein [Crassaminicella indica]|uniref:Monovalent cation/H+ antiporter subunit D family protein n=1 Tax=Crassaminicella indica TaxID=2855394 RepID=A0ABX8RD01_9CLOT|nr:proton-conducting transporter membrane subunit [Crassaminicella indica]QXM06903.1 monovalent cation/H+ antiporter subunit D family protein [Crassaminicella indica]
MVYENNFPLLIILILFISAFTMPLIKKNALVKLVSLLTMGVSFLLGIATFLFVKENGSFFYKVGHFDAPWGIEFQIGTVESIMAILFTGVATLILWYALYSIEKEIKPNKVGFYYLLINILVGSLLGMVFSNDLFNCFVFIEVTTLASCGIIVVKDKKENIAAAIKYLILSCLGSGLVLMGIAFLYDITGNLNMTYIHKELMKGYESYQNTLHIAAGLFTVGIGIKSAMFPMHIWLPDAHSSAPASSSAILSALVLKSPVLLLIKILYRVFGDEMIYEFSILNLILILGTMGMIMGSVFALRQKEIKRVIAYSSVAQMGYIFFGIGLGNKLGLIMAIFHIIGHAVTKSLLFLTAGRMIEKTGNKKLSELKGVGKEMPYTLGLFTIGALSMVGIPILPGFISKWYLSLASIDATKYMYIAAILLSSLLNAAYYFPIVVNGYFGEENIKDKLYKSNEKDVKALMPIALLMIGMIVVGAISHKIIDVIALGLV